MTKSFLLLAGWLLGLSLAGQGITAAEYFWDTDPGPGNGMPLQAVDGNFGDALEAILLETATLPPVGPHTLGIRARDVNNNWGPAFTTVIVVEPSIFSIPEIRITAAEFFWDSDPGVGNGTPMLAFDGDFNSALEQVMVETSTLPPVGTHVLGMRARDAHLNWGPVFRVVVDVLPGAVSFPEIRVAAAEYYVNDDPGPGFGTPMLATDGAFNSALEAIRGGDIPTPVVSGVNVLWMRARDPHGNWGPSFGIVVNIDTTITQTVAVPEPELPQRDVVLLPNPTDAANGFSIRFSDMPGDVRVLLLDAGGRQVAEHHFMAGNEVRVPLGGAARGLYHVGVFFREGPPEWRRLVVH